VKVSGSLVFITYGRPDERVEIFIEALEGKNYNIDSKMVSMSLMSNFINILRNNSSDFSLTQAVKDKDVLASSILETCIAKLKIEREDLKQEKLDQDEELKAKTDKIDNKILKLKLLKMLHDKKKKEIDKKPKDKAEELSDSKLNGKTEVIKSDGNSRRSHCYIYIVTKLD
jgi:hypothetical protein